jgi:CRISPR/Cas system-associated exonuclease Cas4 (RecB family)
MKDFDKCSSRYYYRINNPEYGVPSVPMKVGTLVHKVMESANTTTYKLAYASGMTEIKKLGLEGEDKKFAVDKLDKSLNNYLTYFKSLTTAGDEVEINFRIPFDTNVNLVGRIDRLNKQRGMVIDWKTSTKDPFQINTDVQFLLYKYAFNYLYHKLPTSVLYANLFTGKLISLQDEGNVNYNNLQKVRIPSMVHRIKDGDFHLEGRKKKGVCENCPYKETCFRENK